MNSEKEEPLSGTLSTTSKSRKGSSLVLSTREDIDFVEAVDREAKLRGVSRSQFVSEAVHAVLNEKGEGSNSQRPVCTDALKGIQESLQKLSCGLQQVQKERATLVELLPQIVQHEVLQACRSMLDWIYTRQEIQQQRKFRIWAISLLGMLATVLLSLLVVNK